MNRAPEGCFAQRHFTLQALPREAWKNQGGWTRPVASAVGHDGQTDWRVSAAEITTAGPFSIFEGLDRQAVMLQGGRLRLRAEQPVDDIRFSGPGSSAAFPGERLLVAEAPTGSDGDPANLRATKWFADAHALIQIPSLQSLKFLRDKSAGAASPTSS